MSYTIYTLPFIAAFIGWLTNYVAIKMLFHPREQCSFFGIKIQGVFPKRQNALAKKIAQVVSTELLTEKDLKIAIEKSTSPKELGEMIDNKLTKLITEKLPIAIPALNLFLNQELINIVKLTILSELEDLVKHITTSIGTKLYSKIDIREIVEEKVRAFSSDKLEELLISIMKKEFRFVENVGAILGFLIGLIQVLLVKAPELNLDSLF